MNGATQMRLRGSVALGAVCAMTLAVSGCGSDSDGGGGAAGSGSGPVKIGLITSLSGSTAAAFSPSVKAVDARLKAYKDAGGKCSNLDFQVTTADDTSSPAGTLAAAQKLVQQNKSVAILEVSSFFYGATQFATTAGKKVPFFGGAFDGAPAWNNTDNNLFGVLPPLDFSKAYSVAGDYAKSQGGTKVAAISYDSPAAKEGMEATLRSTDAAGLSRGYINEGVPFGSTDVGAIVLGIINSKSDVVQFGTNPETSFAVMAGLKQANYKVKALVSPTGYGADLLQSPTAVQAAQGLSFTAAWKPTELKTPQTEQMTTALKKYAGSTSGIPGFGQAMGWFTADLLLHSLELNNCDASQDKIIAGLRKDKTWDGDSLLPAARDFSTGSPDSQCSYYVKLEGNGFVPEKDASPLCGNIIG
jgi:ABC-type branched-subunit amino acid transport system substrate-binding protein